MRILKFLLVTLIFLNACGGGSSGTGTSGTVVNGTVKSANDLPIAGALVTILNNGTSTRTDTNGIFTLVSETIDEMSIQLEIAAGDLSDIVEVSNAAEAGGRIEVQVKLDNDSKATVAEEVSATAKVVGYCDFAFENKPTIRQGNRLPNETECTLKVTVAAAAGVPIGDAPFVLQARPCAGRNPWATVARGVTRPNGIGQAQFFFFDTIERCDYRAIVPYRLEGVKGVIFPLHTFGKQAFDKEQAMQGK